MSPELLALLQEHKAATDEVHRLKRELSWARVRVIRITEQIDLQERREKWGRERGVIDV